MHKKINGIYVITPNTTPDLIILEHIISKYKVSILQYRHKTNDIERKQNEALALQALCLKHHTLFIINDDVNLAKKINADGVHLGKNDSTIVLARQILGANAIIGVSCYNNLSLAQAAQTLGANYVAFGALFTSKTKPDAVHCSLDIIKQAQQTLTLPIVGIGGIDFNNQQQALDAGCDAVAIIDALFETTALDTNIA